MHTYDSYVALGDSFTEGLGDDDDRYPNGVRGWADRTAEQLARTNPDFRYANLAIRGRLISQVLEEQVPRALELKPSLISICAGGNDVLRGKIDIDARVADYAEALKALQSTGAQVVTFTCHDFGWSPVFKVLRGRAAIYNELLREVVEDLGVTLVDYWRFRGFDDPRMWAWDRLHLSTLGHQRMAAEVLDTLGVEHDVFVPELDPLPEVEPAQRRRENLVWTKDFAAPWVGRRLRGTSSGDGITPKSTELEPVIVLP